MTYTIKDPTWPAARPEWGSDTLSLQLPITRNDLDHSIPADCRPGCDGYRPSGYPCRCSCHRKGAES